ncbi:hypothetical protein BAUCODRAFT_127294 [Baudoinia panamericana UAMH 10762]|uniref:Uncharacterized protein n=1 Tax=Baudoinia panamericana (strain UAMH 10762) TaxID=717646 RepID=M2M468_BAUPA|nr:uncharacterized protein BAUCODRAFT_127294 [Baudoinia panamericana UAMH 10762]EMC91391.1 hypothetical protein BAUCODRAFT_127294 [Baudoinia panamericana UAMH 10762]
MFDSAGQFAHRDCDIKYTTKTSDSAYYAQQPSVLPSSLIRNPNPTLRDIVRPCTAVALLRRHA